ncbi:hypothetical protein RvY_13774 [Ramazzottius varieornatus]|uniref:Uncharacterized protein n=1 Tax=Ramazzottius varieornatus TaxID=947166 RepID=A0A1D1VT22_RAMVA|nr:hypothetical protein RvY_13774 [Ramazzottius varieornatus]
MSLPDFQCTIEDNRGILIAIHPLQCGRNVAPSSLWTSIIDAVSYYQQLCFENTPREVHFRYQTRQSVKLERTDLQVFRRVFGLICIAVADPTVDQDTQKRDLLDSYAKYLTQYEQSVLESRCLVFRSEDGSKPVPAANGKHTVDGASHSTHKAGKPAEHIQFSNGFTDKGRLSELLLNVRPVQKSASENNLNKPPVSPASPTFAKTYIEIVLNEFLLKTVSEVMEEYLLALFSHLEQKRPPTAPEKHEKDWKGSNPSLDKMDHSRKEGFKFELGSSAQKKRKLGWMRKTYAEWLLLAGLSYPACQHFAQAVDTLQSVKDFLQLGTALEGWAAASWCVLPAADPQLALKLTAMDDSKRRIILTKAKAASLNGYLVNGFNMNLLEQSKDRKSCLLSDAIYDKLRQAAAHYSSMELGQFEMEVSLKSARLFIFLGDKILGHKGLRQAIFVKMNNLPANSSEGIDRFLTVASVYEGIGFHRQAALFRLLAADRYVGPNISPSDFLRAYELTMMSLPSYDLALSNRTTNGRGWPELQAQVMLKLATTCRAQPEVYKRILLIILERFVEVLSSGEKEDLIRTLNELMSQSGPPKGEVLTSTPGLKLAVITLTKIPFVHEFFVLPLPVHLQPLQRPKLARGISGPFLYTPIKSASSLAAAALTADEANFMWVAKEPCAISLHLTNFLPRELKVDNLTIVTENTPFEAAKASMVLPALTNHYLPVLINGIPLEAGTLSILGYSYQVFGMENRCLLSELSHLSGRSIPKAVRVAPSLPQLKVETSLPLCDKIVEFEEPVVTTANILLYNGQRGKCTVRLSNIGKELVESLSVLVSCADEQLAERCISFDSTKLASALPIKPGAIAEVELDIWAAMSFLVKPEDPAGGPQSFQFIVRIDYSGGPGLLKDFYRLLSVAFFVEVLPSVMIRECSILADDDSEHFFLVVDFENRTDEEIEVFYPPEKKMLIIGKDRARVPALTGKIPVKPDATLQEQVRDRMAQDVQLTWKFVDKDARGHCWIGDLMWKDHEIDVVSLPPVLAKFRKDKMYLGLGCSVQVGEYFNLDVELTNRFSSPLRGGLKVDLEFREESHERNSITATSLSVHSPTVGLIGGTFDHVLDFEADQKRLLTYQIVMFVPGVFHLDVVLIYAKRRHKIGNACVITATTAKSHT